jgi:hypothetical protein
LQLLYILSLGSPTHPLPSESYGAWTGTYQWENLYDIDFLFAAPLFIHQLSHVWIDFRGIQDEFMREKRSDYFENSRRATAVQRQYARRNPMWLRKRAHSTKNANPRILSHLGIPEGLPQPLPTRSPPLAESVPESNILALFAKHLNYELDHEADTHKNPARGKQREILARNHRRSLTSGIGIATSASVGRWPDRDREI